MSVPLETAATATFSAAGIARVFVGPGRANIKWKVTSMVTSTTSDIDTQLQVYKNVETPSALVANTYSGNNDENDSVVNVRTGENLLFIWSGGTPGKLATIVIYGEII